MANTSAPFGFSQYQGTGSLPTYEQTQLAIAQANTTPVYLGDPVAQATGTTGLGTGYITQAAAPQALAISGFALSNGLVTATFTTNTAPAVGATLVLFGLTTATTLNGSWTILASTTTTAVFAYSGGAVSTQATTGYVFTPVAGIFIGCRYYSISQRKPVWQPNWAGTSDASGDITAYVVTDPNAQFVVQTANSNTTATAVGVANIGQNIGFSLGTPNTLTGLSGAYADQYTLAANYPTGYTGQLWMPFRIVALANYTPGFPTPLQSINGNDYTTAYNRVVVGFNNSASRNLAGI